jgi:hypothetical protein
MVFLELAIWERRRMMLPASKSGYSISRLEQIGIDYRYTVGFYFLFSNAEK